MVDSSDEQYAYDLHLSQCDPDALRAEAERLYEEVIADYGDSPTSPSRYASWRPAEGACTGDGKPLTDEDRRPARGSGSPARATLGETAEARLDEMHNLAVGKPAPEIDGVDFDGKPRSSPTTAARSSPWSSGAPGAGRACAEVPHERELVERLKGKPFAMLGVDCDEDKQAAVKVMEDGADHLAQLARRRTGIGPDRRALSHPTLPDRVTSSMRRGSSATGTAAARAWTRPSTRF